MILYQFNNELYLVPNNTELPEGDTIITKLDGSTRNINFEALQAFRVEKKDAEKALLGTLEDELNQSLRKTKDIIGFLSGDFSMETKIKTIQKIASFESKLKQNYHPIKKTVSEHKAKEFTASVDKFVKSPEVEDTLKGLQAKLNNLSKDISEVSKKPNEKPGLEDILNLFANNFFPSKGAKIKVDVDEKEDGDKPPSDD